MRRSGKERKIRRRARRQLHHTYDLERVGINPADAKVIAAVRRAAPEPRDGILFTGPLEYVLQDIARIRKLRDTGYFTEKEKTNIERQMGVLVAKGGPAAVAAYRAMHSTSQRDQALELKMLEMNLKAYELERKDEADEAAEEAAENPQLHQHVHFHGSGEPMASPIQNFLHEMKAIRNAGKEFISDDPDAKAEEKEADKNTDLGSDTDVSSPAKPGRRKPGTRSKDRKGKLPRDRDV